MRTAILAAAVALFVSWWGGRTQRRMAQDQRVWQERKPLYLDMLREQTGRRDAVTDVLNHGFPNDAPPFPAPDPAHMERIRDLEARKTAFASSVVAELDHAAVLEVMSYTAVLDDLHSANPNRLHETSGRQEPAERLASEKYHAAEDRLTEQIRAELTWERWSRVRRWWYWLRRNRLGTRPE